MTERLYSADFERFVVRHFENAMDQLWGVPFTRRPGFVRARVQALALLLALAVWAIGGTVLAGAATVGTGYGIGWKILLVLGSTLLDFGLFWFAFRALTSQDVSWRMLRGGAAAAAVGYEALQLVGGYYVGHAVASAGNTYGTFALVIGLLSFIYLAVHITLLAAESNVVAARKLWPRSISIGGDQPARAADEAALAQRGKVEKAALEIRARHPSVGVLVLSQYVELSLALKLLADSAEGIGYLLKDRISDVDEFLAAVRRVADGGSALDPIIVSTLLSRQCPGDPLARLTPREREVLELIAAGSSNHGIADKLVITLGAVEKYVSSIFGKLGLPSTGSESRRVLAVLMFLRS